MHESTLAQAQALMRGETSALANAANLAALIWRDWPDINWAGFYFRQADELVLGPFQGQPACTRIAWGKGVCGSAAAQRRSLVVPDVHAFPGHIACDAASASELVVPIVYRDELIGVLDIDSPRRNRFSDIELAAAQALVAAYIEALNSVSCAAPDPLWV